MNGKGSRRRESAVSIEAFGEKWDRCFGARARVRLIVVDLSTLAMSGQAEPVDWARCCLCDGTMMSPLSHGGGIWDSDDCYCETCGAVDGWNICDYGDGNVVASLRLLPDDGDEVRVVRDVWETHEAKRVWWLRFEGADVDWVVDETIPTKA